MTIAGKVWGQTELVEANGALEFHRIEFKAGYECSEHKHEYKWNGFYVESGQMLIKVWHEEQGLVDETMIGYETSEYIKYDHPQTPCGARYDCPHCLEANEKITVDMVYKKCHKLFYYKFL